MADNNSSNSKRLGAKNIKPIPVPSIPKQLVIVGAR